MNFFPGVSSAIGPVPFSGSPAMNWTKSFMSAESPGLLLSLSAILARPSIIPSSSLSAAVRSGSSAFSHGTISGSPW